jgi:hypothetical protein
MAARPGAGNFETGAGLAGPPLGPQPGQSNFPEEPCGRCGHDVNTHAYDAENEMAGECEECGCDGFVTATARTKFGPFGEANR